jgi:hypothetical protein
MLSFDATDLSLLDLELLRDIPKMIRDALSRRKLKDLVRVPEVVMISVADSTFLVGAQRNTATDSDARG